MEERNFGSVKLAFTIRCSCCLGLKMSLGLSAKKRAPKCKLSAEINNFTPPPTLGVSYILMGTRLGVSTIP